MRVGLTLRGSRRSRDAHKCRYRSVHEIRHYSRMRKKRSIRRGGPSLIESQAEGRLFRFILTVGSKDEQDRPEGMEGAFLTMVVRAKAWGDFEAALPDMADELGLRITAIDEVEELPSIARDEITVDMTGEGLAPEEPDLTLHWYPPEG